MKFPHLHEKPPGTRPFDANMDNEALAKTAALMTKAVEDTQRALVPPELCPPPDDDFFKIEFEVLMVKNLTTGEKYFLALFKGSMKGTPIKFEIDTKRIAGVTPEDEILFAAGPSTFYTAKMEAESRQSFIDTLSQVLKESGYGGDITKLLKDKMGGDFPGGMFGQPDDPSDWWKEGDGPPSSQD